jgi:hypothetical protein
MDYGKLSLRLLLVRRTITMIFVRIVEAVAGAKKEGTNQKGDRENR